jgi:hypothetical protein
MFRCWDLNCIPHTSTWVTCGVTFSDGVAPRLPALQACNPRHQRPTPCACSGFLVVDGSGLSVFQRFAYLGVLVAQRGFFEGCSSSIYAILSRYCTRNTWQIHVSRLPTRIISNMHNLPSFILVRGHLSRNPP